jgi:hypothetical protein
MLLLNQKNDNFQSLAHRLLVDPPEIFSVLFLCKLLCEIFLEYMRPVASVSCHRKNNRHCRGFHPETARKGEVYRKVVESDRSACIKETHGRAGASIVG